MLILETFNEIIARYNQFGWSLRTVLVSREDRETLMPAIRNLDEGVEVREFDIPCLWFSRRSRPDCETWEIRRIVGSPYAITEVVFDAETPEVLQALIHKSEERMRDTAGSLRLQKNA